MKLDPDESSHCLNAKYEKGFEVDRKLCHGQMARYWRKMCRTVPN